MELFFNILFDAIICLFLVAPVFCVLFLFFLSGYGLWKLIEFIFFGRDNKMRNF